MGRLLRAAELRLLSFFSFLPKTENVKEEKGEERKVAIEFGHGDICKCVMVISEIKKYLT